MNTRKPKTKKLLTYLTVFCLLPATLAGDSPTIHPRGKVTDVDAPETTAIENGRIQGFTEPYADISMAAAEMGTLSAVVVKDGDVVEAGQVIANLDDGVLRASLDVARAGMEATGELESAQTQLDLKKVELEKLTGLFGRNHASQMELDRVRGEVRVAESRIQSVREDLEVRRLEHARIEAQLRQREIRSTIDGVVISVEKDRGEFVSPSDPVVARIVQLDPLLIVFSVPNVHRGELTTGQTARLKIGPAETSVEGQVEFISPTANASSGTFRVKVRLPNSDRRWHGGEKTILVLDQDVPTFVAPKQIAKKTK